jgi:hypothetical protein
MIKQYPFFHLDIPFPLWVQKKSLIMDQSEHFKRAELACIHSGLCRMAPDFMEVLENTRRLYGKEASRLREKLWKPNHAS